MWDHTTRHVPATFADAAKPACATYHITGSCEKVAMLAKKKQAILPTQWGHRCWLKFHSFCSRPPEIHSFSSIVLRSSSPRHTHPNNPPAPLVGPPACDGSSVTLARSFFHVRFGHEVNCSPFKFALSMKAGKVRAQGCVCWSCTSSPFAAFSGTSP